MRLFRSLVFILGLLVFHSCGKSDFRSDWFNTSEIISGNQVRLVNGYVVKLIGISDSERSRQYLKDHVLGQRVKFVFDSKTPYRRLNPRARDKSFYAYLVTGVRDPKCVNSEILKSKASELELTPVLNDSLIAYMNYTGMTATKVKEEGDKIFKTGGCEDELEKLIVASDYMNSITRNFAVKQASNESGVFNLGQISEIFQAISPPNWHYVNDPQGAEFFSKASQTITETNLSGDCDDFAILMYSMITAIGGKSRINFVWGSQGGHAFAEVDISRFDPSQVKAEISRKFPDYKIDKLHYKTDENGTWLNLDWWAAYPGGRYTPFTRRMTFYPKENQCNVQRRY